MNGSTVSVFESEFAAYVGARYAIALTNGTATLETALSALGVGPNDKVATTPLTMAATTMAILNVGAVPRYCDVDAKTWLMPRHDWDEEAACLAVSLYGLHCPPWPGCERVIDDAAQTLRPHGGAAFTSYSFQKSKILSTGEGGMLVTDSEELATLARSYSSLGYDMQPTQARIDKAAIKSPTAIRHVRGGINARMNDATAALGLEQLARADELRANRQFAAALYKDALRDCDWLTPQYVPAGWKHDYWAFTVALPDATHWDGLAALIVKHGGEMPYGAWRLTYQEPAFRHLAPPHAFPTAESLQPRLMQFQTNHLESAVKNARALRLAVKEIHA